MDKRTKHRTIKNELEPIALGQACSAGGKDSTTQIIRQPIRMRHVLINIISEAPLRGVKFWYLDDIWRMYGGRLDDTWM